MVPPANNSSMDTTTISGQVIDVYQKDLDTIGVRVSMRSLRDGSTSVEEITVKPRSRLLHFTVRYWSEYDYRRHGYSTVIRRREFFSGYDVAEILVGVVQCEPPSQWTKEHEKLIRCNRWARILNPNRTLLDEFRAKHPHVYCGNHVHFHSKDGSSYDVGREYTPDKMDARWLIGHLELDIEAPSRRPDPVANWYYASRRFGMDVSETRDEPTQGIRSIRLSLKDVLYTSLFSGDGICDARNEMTMTYDNKGDELQVIEDFLEWWEGEVRDELQMLLVWRYEEGLEYIRDRWMYLQHCDPIKYPDMYGELESKIMRRLYGHSTYGKALAHALTWKSPEEDHQQCISVEYLRFDAPTGYPYLSLFYLHHLLLRNHDGFSLAHLMALYKKRGELALDASSRDFCFFLLCQHRFFAWVHHFQQLFGADHRGVLGPFWKLLYRVLLVEAPSEKYIFSPRWHGKDDLSCTGGLVLEAEVKQFLEDTYLFDVVSSYPSAMLEYNMCFTTRLINYKKKKEEEDQKRKITTTTSTSNLLEKDVHEIELLQTRLEFIEVDQEESSMDSDDSNNPYQRPPDEPKAPSSSSKVQFVRSHVRRGVIPQFIERMLAIRTRYEKRHLINQIIKFFVNRIYGMFHSGSIFHCAPIAKSITTIGQQALRALCYVLREDTLCVQKGVKIVAGDTDGVAICTEHGIDKEFFDHVIRRFEEHTRYRFIKIRFDTHLACVYFVNRKNYFALNEQRALVERGTEGVRKDRIPLTRELCQEVELAILRHTTVDLDDIYEYWAALQQDMAERINAHLKEPGIECVEDNFTLGKYKFLTRDAVVQTQDMMRQRIQSETIPKLKEYFEILKNLVHARQEREHMTNRIDVPMLLTQ
jgi:hypothetical protein